MNDSKKETRLSNEDRKKVVVPSDFKGENTLGFSAYGSVLDGMVRSIVTV